jgi:large repetitive protein
VKEIEVDLCLRGRIRFLSTPPQIAGGFAGPDPNTITLNFSEPVTWTEVTPGDPPRGLSFTVITDGSGGEGLLAAISGGDWLLTYVSGRGSNQLIFTVDTTIASSVDYPGAITVSYDQDDSPGNIYSTDGLALVHVYNSPLINTVPDSSLPVVSGSPLIAAAGTTIQVSFDDPIVGGTTGTGGFAVTASGGAVTASYNSSPTAVSRIYTLSRAIAQGETVTLAYTSGGNGNIQDTSGNALANFTGLAVTNNSTQAAPTVTDREIGTTGTQLRVKYSEAISGGTTGNGGYTITASGGAVTATYGLTSLGWYYYNFSRTIKQGETVTLAYTSGGNGNIVDTAGTPLANFTGAAVTNNSTVP